MFTEKFIRDVVLPEVQASGGATVLTSPYGMPAGLLYMDQYQPPTWVVGMGGGEVLYPDSANDVGFVTRAAESVFNSSQPDSWSGVGFWVNDGWLYIDPIRIFTNHYMALEAAKKYNQLAIYAMHTGELEFLAPNIPEPLVPLADR